MGYSNLSEFLGELVRPAVKDLEKEGGLVGIEGVSIVVDHAVIAERLDWVRAFLTKAVEGWDNVSLEIALDYVNSYILGDDYAEIVIEEQDIERMLPAEFLKALKVGVETDGLSVQEYLDAEREIAIAKLKECVKGYGALKMVDFRDQVEARYRLQLAWCLAIVFKAGMKYENLEDWIRKLVEAELGLKLVEKLKNHLPAYTEQTKLVTEEPVSDVWTLDAPQFGAWLEGLKMDIDLVSVESGFRQRFIIRGGDFRYATVYDCKFSTYGIPYDGDPDGTRNFIDFSGANFSGAEINKLELTGVAAERLVLGSAKMGDCTLIEVAGDFMDFAGANLNQVTFDSGSFEGAKWLGTCLSKSIFRGIFAGVSFTGTTFKDCKFENVMGVRLVDCDLDLVRLSLDAEEGDEYFEEEVLDVLILVINSSLKDVLIDGHDFGIGGLNLKNSRFENVTIQNLGLDTFSFVDFDPTGITFDNCYFEEVVGLADESIVPAGINYDRFVPASPSNSLLATSQSRHDCR